MKRLLYFVLLIPYLSLSQTQIQGIVTDSSTGKPLPFASIVTNTNFGTLTDVDGKFHIKTTNSFNQISISYVGYKTISIPIIGNYKFISANLETSIEKLNEVLITARENPALQIIRNAIANKYKNNIEKSLSSFKFNAYNKLVVTANPDSISGEIDSVFVFKGGQKKFKEMDSTNYEFKKEIEKQHLYISEKISEFQFQNGKKKKEVVLASRMAGLKQPIYEFFGITFQDFSFYNEFYTIAGTKYINPIASNALKKYNYKILDTVVNENGTSIMIHFKPKEKTAVLGIEGVLYLDTKTYAITKAIAELKGVIHVKTTQNYTYIDEQNIWFPIDKDVVIRKGYSNENIALFGGIINVSDDQSDDSKIKTSKKNPSDVSYFMSKSVNSNITINPPLVVKKSAATIQFNDDAHKRSEEFWNTYRSNPLTKRGENAYRIIDSLVEDEGVEKKINLARNILKGYLPTKYINLDLGKIVNLNNYEGFRFGFGGETNTNFSSKFKIESYVAYGTKDKDFKYSFGLSTRLSKSTNTWLGANFINDLKEAASLDFIADNTSFSPINPRNLNISKFYNYKTIQAYLKHDIQPNLEGKLQLTSGDFTPVFNYKFISTSKNLSRYKLTTAAVVLQYNPTSEYMNSPIGKIKIKNEFPQFTFQLSKSFQNIFAGDFDFTQINLRVLHKIKRLRKATTTILTEGGIVFGDAPISHLYNSTPNYTFKNPWLKRVTFAGKNSFETMGYNEFISDRFAAIHIKHILKPFKIGKRFKPQLTLVSRAAIGEIDNPLYHTGLVFKSLAKGYLESGFELNSLFKGFGLSTFYRYGTYKNTEWSDNLALKLTYNFRLGF